MMSRVLPDGYVLGLLGSFHGKDNDASMSKVILLRYLVCLSESRFPIVKNPCFIKCDDISFFIRWNTFAEVLFIKNVLYKKGLVMFGSVRASHSLKFRLQGTRTH